MKAFLKNFILVALVGIVFTFQACKNDDEKPVANEQQSATDNTEAESQFDDVVNIEDNAMGQFRPNDAAVSSPDKDGEEITDGPLNGYTCATVTVVKNSNGRTVTVDFGNSTTGCIGADLKVRKGKIIITFERNQNSNNGNPYDIGGLTVTTTFDNYSVNGVKVEGTKTVTRLTDAQEEELGLANNVRAHKIVVTGGKLTFLDGRTITWTCDRTRVWNNNATPINFLDDTLTIWGSYSGVNRNGASFAGNVPKEKSIGYKSLCFLSGVFIPTQGELTLTSSAHPTAVIDYGNDTCDKTFTITINGQTYTVNL